MVGLGQPEASDELALGHLRQVAVLLLLGTPGINRVHRERALHRGERAQAGIAGLELLHDQPIGDVVHPGASVAFEIGAENTELGHLRHQLERKSLAGKMALDFGQNLALDELPDRVARSSFLRGRAFVEVEKVEILE